MIKVMSVDDSSTIRRVIKNSLGQLFNEYEFVEAGCGLEALEVLKEHPDVGLMFLDINMPGMNGEQFLTQLRKNPDYNKIKVVMATTEAEKQTVLRMMKIGANGYLIKPFNLASIKKAIEPIVSRMGIEIK
ncbi:MAG: response regulator [Campylobacterales bacterium]|nr:response regulator [Campylobacterales bacterium]